ncbi:MULTISPECIES: DUF3422 family protein [Neptunomonas]|uniref:DUF3422 family protein n=1 Tax=Neptunomonas TaxID=75687 RepID=UPI0031B61B1A
MESVSTGMSFHPHRDDLYEEMHSRPFQVIPSPARLTHIALICDEAEKREQFNHLRRLFELLGQQPPERDEMCVQWDFGDFRIRLEKHLEFIAFTFVNLAVENNDDPFAVTGISSLPSGWLDKLPGKVISAVHVSVKDSSEDGDYMLPKVRRFFEGMRLIGSSPQQGDARIWTTFRLHSDGFGRMLICNKRMSDSQLGRLTQRLMEIETYRLMALIGLPTAREYSPQLRIMDTQIAELTQRLSSESGEDESDILKDLTRIASKVEDYRAKTTFRFAASQAYHELVLKRLAELREDEVSGHLTMTEFMTRRLSPAIRTCDSVGQRLEDMSRRIDRVSDMMRTRIELSIQEQNQELLSSMDRRSKIQLMMQHTVEGLSVAAISYYSIGLIKLIIDALYDSGLSFNKHLVLGAAVPVVVGGVWLATRRIHKHFLALAREQRDADLADEERRKSK